MTKQLTELESEAYTKIITAIDAVTKLIDKTAQSLPRDSEVRRYLAYCAFDVRNNLLDSMYNKLMNWEEVMTDIQKIAKRIMRMIEAGETGQDVFARDAGTLAELILNIEELTTKRFK